VEKHLEFMAGAGIDACVISSSPVSVDQCRMCNEYYHELGRQYPDKFFYLTPCLPLKEGAFDILDQGINKYGYKGVIISPQNAGEMLDSRRLWPFYEKMSNYNLPIFIHVSGHVLGGMMPMMRIIT
jgi:predicted TIM-barrel fold metal-dependent hydrolase